MCYYSQYNYTSVPTATYEFSMYTCTGLFKHTRQVTRAPCLSLSRNAIINFQTRKRYKTIRHCLFLHTLYKRIGYVIIPKPHFQDVNVYYKQSLSPFLLVVFVVLAQSVTAMTINRSCVLAGHGRSITTESSVTPLFIQQTIERQPAFAKVYVCFSRIKKCWAELRRDLVTGYTVRRYEQLETFPEMIEQELRPAVCER